VVLVLLIIFMWRSPRCSFGYDSASPNRTQLRPPPRTAPTFILKLSADANGTLEALKLNNDTVPRLDLVDRTRTQMQTVQDRDKVFHRLRRHRHYNDLMRVVDDLRMAGVKTIGFATDPIRVEARGSALDQGAEIRRPSQKSRMPCRRRSFSALTSSPAIHR